MYIYIINQPLFSLRKEFLYWKKKNSYYHKNKKIKKKKIKIIIKKKKLKKKKEFIFKCNHEQKEKRK